MSWIKKLYYQIKWKLYYWFNDKAWVCISLNPFKHWSDWRKVRKVFRKPKVVKYKYDLSKEFYGYSSDYMRAEYGKCGNKLLRIKSYRCDWKSKYGEVRFETVPYLTIVWRNKTRWIFGLESPVYEEQPKVDYDGEYNKIDILNISTNNLLYWEGILSYLYEHDKDIVKTYKNNIWVKSYQLKNDINVTNKKLTIEYTILNMLKQKYAEKIVNYIIEKHNKEKINNNK